MSVLRLGTILVALVVAGCTVSEAICRCLLEACAGEICGQAVRLSGAELHRIDPMHGSMTACGIEIDEHVPAVRVEDAEDELRAGGGHAPCWRP